MAQMTVRLGFKLHWWVKPALLAAAWAACPVLWLLGEDATERYIEALSALLMRVGIGRCSIEDATHEVTLD